MTLAYVIHKFYLSPLTNSPVVLGVVFLPFLPSPRTHTRYVFLLASSTTSATSLFRISSIRDIGFPFPSFLLPFMSSPIQFSPFFFPPLLICSQPQAIDAPHFFWLTLSPVGPGKLIRATVIAFPTHDSQGENVLPVADFLVLK